MSKIGKKLKKAIENVKEGNTNLVYDGKWHKDGKVFDTFDEYSAYADKLEKEKLKKMSPEKRKALKEKEKRELAREKEADKKREEKWAKQRATRGFSDDWCWSIDYTLLKLIPDMIEQMMKNMHGWQPYLGYKYDKKLKKVIKLKPVRTKDKYTGKIVKRVPEITFKEEQEVLKYLINGFRQLHKYLDKEDIDYKKFEKLDKKEFHKFYEERQKKVDELHKEIFGIFSDIFYSLWD